MRKKNYLKLKNSYKKLLGSYILIMFIIGSINVFTFNSSAMVGHDVLTTYEYIGFLNQTTTFTDEDQIFVNITADNLTGDPEGQYYFLKALNENSGDWVKIPVSDNDTNFPFENNTANDGEYWGFFNVSQGNETQNTSPILQVTSGDTINISEDPASQLKINGEAAYIIITIVSGEGEVENNPPNSPHEEIPFNGTTNSFVGTNLSWNCSDPDSDNLTYDVYFANTLPLALVESNTSNMSYNPPEDLGYDTTYYWQIIAWDDNGSGTAGPSWWFHTESEPGEFPPEGDSGTGTLIGMVRDHLDYPLPGATVVLNRIADEPQMPQIVVSNETGVYLFDDNVTVGTYDIEAFKEGCELFIINNVTIFENQTRWENITLFSGDHHDSGDIFVDEWQSSISDSFIMNNTAKDFTAHLIIHGSPEDRLKNVTINLPIGFTCHDTNWTSLTDASNITVYHTDNSIVWEKNNQEGFFFSQNSYFLFNASTNAPLGSYQFNISVVYGDDNTSQTISKTVFVTTLFYTYGIIKDSDGQPIEGAVANVSVQSFGMDGCVNIGSFTDETNSTGVYNITNVPTIEDVSTLDLDGPMGPGGVDGGLFYQLSAQKNSGTNSDLAISISPSLPYIPITEYVRMLQGPEVYLKPALTFRVNVTGPIYNWNHTMQQMDITYGPKNFSLMVKDKKLGYQVKEFNTMDGERTFSVPKFRNYSFSVFADQSFPISILFNDIAATCAGDGSLNQDGVSTDYMEYNGTYLINVSINVSSTGTALTGFFNNITNPTDMRVVAYTMEDRDMVFEDWSLPYNLGDEMGQGIEDDYNLTTGWYNVTLPATVASSYYLLRAYARNDSGYYMGSAIISSANGQLSSSGINFDMMPLIEGGVSRIVTSNNVSDNWNETSIVNTTAVLFKLVSNGEELSNENPFVEIKRELNDEEYKQMINGESGCFNLSLVEGASLKKLTIYSQQYAPISIPVSASMLNGSTNNSIIMCSDGTCNITMRSFGDDPFMGKNASLKMMMLKSNQSCNVPNPPDYCDLCADEYDGEDDNGSKEIEKDDFSPFKAILKGDISLMLKSNSSEGWIYVYYITVDLLASGPPDAAFSTESQEAEGGLAKAWQFGSQGPEIYDYVLIGMPLSDDLVNKTVKVDIPVLYDSEFEEIWNASEGDTIDDIRNDSDLNSSYWDYLGNQYEAYLNGTGVICDPNNPTLSNGLGYKDINNRTIWIKIPHFSGVGPEVTGEEPNPPSSFTVVANSINETYLTWSLGTGADYTRIQRKTGSYPVNISDGDEVCNQTDTSALDGKLAEDTTYYYRAWSWNQTNSCWSVDNSSYSIKTKARPYKTGESPINGLTNVNPLSSLYVICRDNDSDIMTATWYSNSSGSWAQFGTVNSSISSGTNITQTNSNFSGYNTTYYWIVNLTDGIYWDNTTYHFITRPQYQPDEPRDFTATATSSSKISLSWTKGNYSDYTIIQRKTGSYPLDISDGTNVYDGTGSSTTSSSLSSSTKYYYRAWAFNSTDGTWSALNASDWATTESSGSNGNGGDGDDDSSTSVTDDDDATDNDTTTANINQSAASEGNNTPITIKVIVNETDEETGIEEVELISDTQFANVKLVAEKLDSNEVTDKPLLDNTHIHSYLDITVTAENTTLDEDDIQTLIIKFKVEQSWIQSNNINKSSIKLLRYHDGKWDELVTELISEDDTYAYFKANVEGTSTFAIVGSEVVTSNSGNGLQAPIQIPWIFLIIAIVAGIWIVVIFLFKSGFLYFEEKKPPKK